MRMLVSTRAGSGSHGQLCMRGIGLLRMRSLVLMAGGRQLAAGVGESASFFFLNFSFSVLSAFLGGREMVAGPVPQV